MLYHLGGEDNDDDGGDEHADPDEPEEDEEYPADSHPRGVVRVLHQLSLAQPLKKR